MTSHRINYYQFHGNRYESEANDFASPFALDGVGFDVEPESKEISKDKIYSACPAWRHRINRIFNVYSPIDIRLEVDIDGRKLKSPNVTQQQFDDYFQETFGSETWCTDTDVTIQSSIPRFLFWSKSKNIWIEQRPHPLTALNNNLVCVGGQFNMSNWTRPISFGFDLVDPNKPVVIKRGDPLYQLSFHSTNQDDSFKLIRTEPSRDVLRKMSRTTNVLDAFNSRLPQDIKNILFKNTESKCPFHFLWK